MSPDLAKFMESQEQEQQQPVAAEVEKSVETSAAPASLTSFEEPKKSSRRVKQAARKSIEEQRRQEIALIVKDLEDILESKGKDVVASVLNIIQRLISSEGTSLKQLTSSKKDYRLAWAGSDEAVCHFGTGLHKVPLARLQEVFLTFPARNRIQLQEVIRILGPFPNVKNVLVGSCTVAGSGVTEWKVTWETVVDGTGKLLAGKEDKTVELDVYYSDESVIVAAMPDCREDPLQDSGKNILLFIRDLNMDATLEQLRVS